MASILGTTGSDVLDGTSTDDTVICNFGNDVANGLGGNDVLDGGGDSDRLFGGAGNDRLIAGPASDSGKDSVYGGQGDDLLDCVAGDFGDLADGGSGIDHITLSYSGFSVPGTAFFVTLTSSFFVLGGGAQGINVQNVERITITTSDGDDFLQGGGYDDVLNALDGFDTLIGRGGNDDLYAGTGDYSVDGGAGVDYLSVDLRAETVGFALTLTNSGKANVAGVGTADGIERLGAVGGTGHDTLTGNALADYLDGWDGSDFITGNGGDDTLNGYSGADSILGGNGNDRIESGNESDTVYGGAGHDLIREAPVSLSGNDQLWGEAGNDRIESGLGDDLVYGGDGNDFIELDGGSDRGYGGGGDDFIRDDLYPPYGDDLLSGGAGNDTLLANSIGGIDTVLGGTGDDSIVGGEDVDGGIGTDLFNTSGSNLENRVIVAGVTGGTFTMRHDGVVGITALNIERFFILGGQKGDTLSGFVGDDTIYGNAGLTFLNPLPALDTDVLDGGAGNDLLVGRDGVDLLTGGFGEDVFRFEKLTDSGAVTAKADRILDFERNLDTIDVTAIDADTSTPGVNEAFIRVSAFSGTAGEAVLNVISAGRRLLQLDSTGDGVADMVIDIRGPAGPATGDLLL